MADAVYLALGITGEWAALRVRDGVQLGVQPALCAADQAAALVVATPPFFARRLEAVRCAFR